MDKSSPIIKFYMYYVRVNLNSVDGDSVKTTTPILEYAIFRDYLKALAKAKELIAKWQPLSAMGKMNLSISITGFTGKATPIRMWTIREGKIADKAVPWESQISCWNETRKR